MKINDRETVKDQYATAEKLNTRISIHTKYSTNRQGFGNWIFEQYALFPMASVLELGCGNGDMWVGKTLPQSCKLTLTDFSAGMLETAQKNLSGFEGAMFQQADVQEIPYPDSSFDIVIANMMLYHVPDISKALREIDRVLKPGGKFYCATYGENGIAEYLQSVFKVTAAAANKTFTLQNGGRILGKQFQSVEKRLYEDSLEVTDSEDLLDYMASLASVTGLENIPRDRAKEILEAQKVNGKIHVPKEYGMFICSK